ncbi:MAG: hypothetical protein ABEJ92_07550 [Halobacteriales archaeon]
MRADDRPAPEDDELSGSVTGPDLVEFEAPVEPGRPAPENVAFVLLGAVLAISVVLRLVQLLG